MRPPPDIRAWRLRRPPTCCTTGVGGWEIGCPAVVNGGAQVVGGPPAPLLEPARALTPPPLVAPDWSAFFQLTNQVPSYLVPLLALSRSCLAPPCLCPLTPYTLPPTAFLALRAKTTYAHFCFPSPPSSTTAGVWHGPSKVRPMASPVPALCQLDSRVTRVVRDVLCRTGAEGPHHFGFPAAAVRLFLKACSDGLVPDHSLPPLDSSVYVSNPWPPLTPSRCLSPYS